MILTIGHSKSLPHEFTDQLREHQVTWVVDVRSHPTSKWSWFRYQEMLQWLPDEGFKYQWWPSLGGWSDRHAGLTDRFAPHGVDLSVYARGAFPKQRIAAQSGNVDTGWTSQGLHDYAWFTTLPEFQDGLAHLVRLSENERVAIVCAEVLWWKCHRSMIADVLKATYDQDAYHILGGAAKPHPIGNRLERYSAEIRGAWHRPAPQP